MRQSKAVAAEILRAVRSADADDVLSMAGEGLLVLGPRAQDAYGSRTDAVLALRETLDPRRKPKLDSGGAVVVAGPGGRAAYLVDRLRLGRKPLVATALLDGHDGIWRLVALQLSHSQAAPRKGSSKGLAAAGSAHPEPPRPGAGVKEASDAGDALVRALAQPATLGQDLLAHDGVAVGTDGSLIAGKKKLEALARRLAEQRYQPTGDPLTAGTFDDSLAFATVLATRQGGKGEPQPVRVTTVWRRSAAGWDLVVLHESQAPAPKP